MCAIVALFPVEDEWDAVGDKTGDKIALGQIERNVVKIQIDQFQPGWLNGLAYTVRKQLRACGMVANKIQHRYCENGIACNHRLYPDIPQEAVF